MRLCNPFMYRRRLLRSVRMTTDRVTVVSLLAAMSLFVFSPRPVAAQTSVYEKILAQKKIGADPPSLAKYLKELHPTPIYRERVKLLIRQLGDSKFSVRETSTRTLRAMPRMPTQALLAAARHDDAEIRQRAQTLLAANRSDPTELMHAAFQVIAANKTPGVTAELLAAIPLCNERYLQTAARRAIDAAAQRPDVAILRKALGGKNVQVRVVATSALGKVLRQDARDDLYPLLDDHEDQVKLAAARAIADWGDRKSLATLVAMLDSDDLLVRVSAASALRGLSGKHLGFAAYDSAEKRAKVVAKWKAWAGGDGKTAKLNFPLRRFNSGRGDLGGNTLLSFGTNDKVALYDPAGKEIWTYESGGPRSAEKMANGNILIAEFSGHRVIQITPQGKVVWHYKITSPGNAKPLPNGNVLIAQREGVKQVIEVDPNGKVVWRYAAQGGCSDAHRLENGNTLIASFEAPIVEVTPAGKVVWQYSAGRSYGIQPLPGGNVLTTNINGRVAEVTRQGKILWEYQYDNVTDAFRLPNGNTLITGSQFIEVTPNKKIVWTRAGCNYGSARR